jgi:molecular chaperone DnaK (HSP70)
VFSASTLPNIDRDGIGIGIDLGTTFSAVAYLKNGIPTIIPIPGNGRTVPSVVSLSRDNCWVGQDACDNEVEHGAYRNVKRVLGTGGKLSPDTSRVVPFLAPSPEGKTFKKDSLVNQINDASEYPTLLKSSYSPGERIRPEVISAEILKALKKAAQDATGEKVSRAVIGVPSYFHDAQCEATKRAAEIAGISKVKLLREPEAAAFAYGIGKHHIGFGDQDELVLVFDLGGGTFDVSMLLIGGGITEILCTSGNVQLGGSNFDARVAQHCWKILRSVGGISTNNWSDDANNACVRAAEQIRIHLSNNRRVNLALPLAVETWTRFKNGKEVILPLDCSEAQNLTESGFANGTHVLCTLSRRNLEQLCRDELQALLRPIREVAIVAGALLPGDASPASVEAALETEEDYQLLAKDNAIFGDFYFETEDNELSSSADDADIHSGLVLELQSMDIRSTKKSQQAGRKRARELSKKERKYRQEKRKIESSPTQGQAQTDERVKIRDGIMGRPISRIVLVGGATRMPAIGRLIEALTGVAPQRSVNPDEAVALGCAVHVGALDGMEGMGTVLNPMQVAILKAVARQQGILTEGVEDEKDFDEGL